MPSQARYKPFFSHYLIQWIDGLPFSRWLFFLLITFLFGAAQHAVAWSKGALAIGELDLYLTFSGAWVVEMLILGHYLEFGAADILAEFRPMLAVGDDEFEQVKYQFTIIPRAWGSLAFLVGAGMGLALAGSVRALSPAIHFVFPELIITGWMFSAGLGVVFTYQIIRQIGQIRQFYSRIATINMYKLDPIYAFSKMTAIIAILVFVIVYLTPRLIDPSSFESTLVLAQTYFFIIICFAIFYIPLANVNRRLIQEKESLLNKVAGRLELVLGRLHEAVEAEDYANVADLRTAFASLREEKEMIEAIPTWPWRPATFRGFASAILLPIAIWLIQQLLSRFI